MSNKIEILNKISASEELFSAPHPSPAKYAVMNAASSEAPQPSGPVTDSNGLLTFLGFTQTPIPSIAIRERDAFLKISEGYLGLVHSYCTSQKLKLGNNFSLVTATETAFDHLPCLTAFSYTSQTFNQTCRGADLAGKFIDTILSNFINPQTPGLGDFSNFIKGVGDMISKGVGSGASTYDNICDAYIIEYIPEQQIVVPTLKLFKAHFDKNSSAIKCSSDREYTFNISYEYAFTRISRDTYTDPDIHDRILKLIKGKEIQEIASSSAFFGEDFSGESK